MGSAAGAGEGFFVFAPLLGVDFCRVGLLVIELFCEIKVRDYQGIWNLNPETLILGLFGY